MLTVHVIELDLEYLNLTRFYLNVTIIDEYIVILASFSVSRVLLLMIRTKFNKFDTYDADIIIILTRTKLSDNQKIAKIR